MGKVVVMNHMTLDGVMQGPGRPDEDPRGGFRDGGWAVPYADEATVRKMGELMGPDHAFLFGRHTYEQLLESWNARGGPFKDALNNTPKYVVSKNPALELKWPNSALLRIDVSAAVQELRDTSPLNLVLMGSGVLLRTLMASDQIDEYLLMIHPLVLGSGQRLFGGGNPTPLRLIEAEATPTGVIMARYTPDRR
ncbi:dihydrofolate reductase family protein [Pseudarthrobacter sp. YAF2]|uniref:dihydrofolate reductase family protein n=1 Tax=Pseudarthrobacter sp. YAF2 TaxID=3233078 RepID=UPI003F9E7077